MLLTSLLLVASLHGGPTAVQSSSETSEATAEGIEILRRIVGDAIDRAFSDKKEERPKERPDGDRFTFGQLGVVTTLMTHHKSVQHSRAFHLPGVGLFFSIDAALPVVEVEEEESKPAEGITKDDAWERTRREVRGELIADGRRVKSLRLVAPAKSEIDPKAIDQLIDVLLGTLARHAARVEGLGRGETVTVALRLSGVRRTWLHDQEGSAIGFGQFGEREEIESPEEGYFSAYVLSSGVETRGQNLVLRVGLDDLSAFTEEGGVGRLRQRALVNLY